MGYDNNKPTLSENVDIEKKGFDLDQAVDIVGIGWYNIKYCLLLAVFLISAIVEVLGYSFILPSAKCDLNMDDSQRGLIASMPYIAVVATSFPWGYLVDTKGRRSMIIVSAFGAGSMVRTISFYAKYDIIRHMQVNCVDVIMDETTVSKSLESLQLRRDVASLSVFYKLYHACCAAVPYTFIGEILPLKHRDLALFVSNACLALGSTVVPLLAWAVLPLHFNVNFGAYYFRPWRLLTMLYSSIFFICGLLMSFGPESPKYLVAQGRHDEALKVLEDMYYGNHRDKSDKFPVKLIITVEASGLLIDPKVEAEAKGRRSKTFFASILSQTLPLMRPPYLKWMVLNGFLLFGICSTLNGLFMWVPDVLNRVLTGAVEGMTACEVIGQRFNQSTSEVTICDDTIDPITFKINSIANFATSLVTLLAIGLLKVVGKKVLLIFMFFIMGSFCIAINFARQQFVFATLLSSLQIPALGIGPINAYAVQMFPTELRGMAVGLGLMFGRIGSVIATNVAGILINSVCEAAFYLFGGLLLVCGFLAFLLPKS